MCTKPTTEVLWKALWGSGGNAFTCVNTTVVREGYRRAGIDECVLDGLMSTTHRFLESGDITEENFESYVRQYI